MNRGDVVLVYVPFVGTSGGKNRPAVVVQCDTLNASVRETMIAEITSNLSRSRKPHQVAIDVSTVDGVASDLITNSAVRCERLHTVPQSDVLRVIGSFSASIMNRVDDALKAAMGIP